MTSPAALDPVLPFSRIRRAEEMLSASRNRVIKRRVVGNTLKSTGLTMYKPTSSTITESVMLVLINISSRNGGNGMIIASTIPSTASGTEISDRFRDRSADGRALVPLAAGTRACTAGRFAAVAIRASSRS